MKDKYLKYSVEQLVEDESFINWVMDASAQSEEEKKNWLAMHPEMKDRMDEATSIIQGLKFEDLDVSDISTEDLWQRIEENVTLSTTEKKYNIRLMYYIASVAASLLLLIFIGIMAPSTSIISEQGSVISHVLPDQSIIQLNDGSRIKYKASKFQEERMVRLDGEAFFSVTEGSPFIVRTNQGSVQVLGTTFNVFSHDHKFTVHCETGKVKITSGNDELILTAGQSGHLNEEGQLTREPSSRKNLTWLEGIYQYEDAPLMTVVKELERQFGVQINIDNSLAELKYTGFFVDNDLDEALQSVFWPLKIKSEKKGTKIIAKPLN